MTLDAEEVVDVVRVRRREVRLLLRRRRRLRGRRARARADVALAQGTGPVPQQPLVQALRVFRVAAGQDPNNVLIIILAAADRALLS